MMTNTLHRWGHMQILPCQRARRGRCVCVCDEGGHCVGGGTTQRQAGRPASSYLASKMAGATATNIGGPLLAERIAQRLQRCLSTAMVLLVCVSDSQDRHCVCTVAARKTARSKAV